MHIKKQRKLAREYMRLSQESFISTFNYANNLTGFTPSEKIRILDMGCAFFNEAPDIIDLLSQKTLDKHIDDVIDIVGVDPLLKENPQIKEIIQNNIKDNLQTNQEYNLSLFDVDGGNMSSLGLGEFNYTICRHPNLSGDENFYVDNKFDTYENWQRVFDEIAHASSGLLVVTTLNEIDHYIAYNLCKDKFDIKYGNKNIKSNKGIDLPGAQGITIPDAYLLVGIKK